MTTHRYNLTTQTVLKLAANGVLRSADLAQVNIARSTLQRMRRQGLLVKLGRGLYAIANANLSDGATLAAVARRVPNCVVCLLSALRFHGMTTQNSAEIWIAIDQAARHPVICGIGLRVVRCLPRLLHADVEPHVVDGVEIQVTNPARTVADCFKHRSKVGLDVALAALQAYVRDRKGSIDDLWRAAVAGRVANVLRPYLEATT